MNEKNDRKGVPVPVSLHKMNYQQADRIGNSSLKTLIVRNLADQISLGQSVKYAIGDKFKAKITRFKRHFDPLNFARMFTGELGAAVIGRIAGRSGDDIKYFGGQRGNSITRHYLYKKFDKEEDTSEKIASKDPLHTTLTAGQHQKLRKGDGLADVLTKTYVLIRTNHELDVKHQEMMRNLSEQKEKEKDRWNAELVKALGGHKVKVKAGKDHDLGGMLKKLLGVVITMVEGLFLSVMGLFKKIGTAILNVVKWLSEIKWLKHLGSLGGLLKNIIGSPLFLASVAGLIAYELTHQLTADTIHGYYARKRETQKLGGDEAVENLPGINALGISMATPEKAQQKINKLIERKQEVIGEILAPLGYKKTGVLPSGRFLFTDKQGKPVPDMYYDDAAIKADKELEKRATVFPELDGDNAPSTYPTRMLTSEEKKNLYGPEMANRRSGGYVTKPKTTESDTAASKMGPPDEDAPFKALSNSTPNVYDYLQNINQNPIGQKLQSVTDNAPDPYDAKFNRPVIIDNSKTIGTPSKGGMPISLDNTVPVRTDDPTLQKIQWQYTRPA